MRILWRLPRRSPLHLAGLLAGLALAAPLIGTVRPAVMQAAAGPVADTAQASAAAEASETAGAPTLVAFALTTRAAFTPNGDGVDDTVDAAFALSSAATASVDVVDFDGTPVAVLLPPLAMPAGTTAVRWGGAGVPDGPYRLRLTVTDASGTLTREIPVARVSRPAYWTASQTVTVFLDVGHGGADSGAEATAADGTLVRESDLDLDIALRLAAMLRASGVKVALSRTADVAANTPPIDRNGDGKIDGYDEYLARIDGANTVRADLFIAIHNNWLPDGKGRTEAFYCGVGCIGSQVSRALAASILDAQVARLSSLQTASWQLTVGNPEIDEAQRNPTDDVLRFGWATLPAGRHFYVLGPYDRSFRPRAIQMPGALMESLALSNPTELELLRQPVVRGLIAAAYYDGIAGWLATRPLGLRLDSVTPSMPTAPRAGVASILRVRLTNNGTTSIPAGSQLVVGSLARVLPYDGSARPGTGIGMVALRAALAPGRSTVLAIPVRPKSAGPATWKVDAIVGGVRASSLRVPPLQIQVTVGR